VRTEGGVVRLAFKELTADGTAENVDWTITSRATGGDQRGVSSSLQQIAP
jgi:hypothetical protein